MEKKGLKCAVCGTEYGIEIHHIVPRIIGGSDEPSNLEPLCYGCHKKKHLENRSELIKIGMEKARHKPSKKQQWKLNVLQYVMDNAEDATCMSYLNDIWMEALDRV